MLRSMLSVVFAGSGGAGAMTAGSIFLRSAAESGYYGLMTQLFGPQVRGGESAALVQIGTEPIECQPDHYDLLVALDWEKVEQFAPEIHLNTDSVILADPAFGEAPKAITKSGAQVIAVAMGDPQTTRLEQALVGIRRNTFAAGLVGALAGIPASALKTALGAVLGRKSVNVVQQNLITLEAGVSASKALKLGLLLRPAPPGQRWLITGNQAVGLGCMRGGLRFVGCYPITPATDLVEWLAPRLERLGGHLLLAEDELAAVNMAVGASFGGSPAMTVTSGPGFSLMVETIGLAVAAEVPLVIVDVMRVGPSTGIPSKTEQSDINISVYGAHGDAPRVVLAPLSVSDCSLTAEWAMYVAESIQTPVIVLSDQMLGQAQAIVDPCVKRSPSLQRRTAPSDPSKKFLRYQIADLPVTPMPLPGTPGTQWVGEGLVHNESGAPVSGAAAHAAQLAKRAKKLRGFDAGQLWGEVTGSGETAILTFGSCVGPAREAAKRLEDLGCPTRVIALRQICPVPMAALGQAFAGVTRTIVLEQNHSAQLFHYLRGRGAVGPECESIARPGPLPFRPNEIASLIG